MFENLRIPGFELEHLCLKFLDELRRHWRPAREMARTAVPRDLLKSRQLTGARFDVVRSGSGRRPLELLADGYVGDGGGYRHAMWWIEDGHELIDCLGVAGYELSVAVTTRDWHCMAASQVRCGHVSDWSTAVVSIRRAYLDIFQSLRVTSALFVVVSYESLVHYREAGLKRVRAEFGLDAHSDRNPRRQPQILLLPAAPLTQQTWRCRMNGVFSRTTTTAVS